MALTNVWWRDANGEWIPTSAAQADQLYPHTVSAESHTFRCFYCYQYVTFTKGYVNARHFRHSSSEQNKLCEERSHSTYSSNVSIEKLTNMPLRLLASCNTYALELGFVPLRPDTLNHVIQSGLKIHIDKNKPAPLSGQTHDQTYVVDASRFVPHATAWLSLPINWAYTYHLSFSPNSIVPLEWRSPITQIGFDGVLFSQETGRIIPERSDIAVNKKYLWLTRRSFPPRLPAAGLEYCRLPINHQGWMLYELTATTTMADVSDFFFDTLHVRLTNYPPELSVLWPPLLEQDDTLDTNAKYISLIVQGEASFAAYPLHHAPYTQQRLINGMSFVSLKTSPTLQLVCAERNQQPLLFRYLRPLDSIGAASMPQCTITDGTGQSITEESLTKPPAQGILNVILPVDGWIDVSDQAGFLYRTNISASESVRLFDMKAGYQLTIRAGLDIVRELCIMPKKPSASRGEMASPPWISPRKMNFDRRHAGLLERIPAGSELYMRVANALKQGKIPEDGWKYLQRLMEE